MTGAVIAIVVVVFLFVLFLLAAVKVAREYERGVIFRSGGCSTRRRARASSS